VFYYCFVFFVMVCGDGRAEEAIVICDGLVMMMKANCAMNSTSFNSNSNDI